MAGETVITVVGNLTSDPELRYTQNGLAVANFTIASTPRTLDRASNEWKDGDALFLRASVWREFAEHVAGSLTKGSRVIAQGRLKSAFSYQDRKRVEQRTSIELEVDEIGPSLRYATAQITRAASSSGWRRRSVAQVGGGNRGGGQQGGRQRRLEQQRWRQRLRWWPVRRAVVPAGWPAGRRQRTGRTTCGAPPAAAATSTTRPRSDPLGSDGHTTSSSSELESRITMAGKSTGDRRKPLRGKGGKNAAPAKSIKRRRHRLQGRCDPSQVHLGAWKDPRPSHHRRLRPGAAPHRPCREERP